jgi:hypothetical protein
MYLFLMCWVKRFNKAQRTNYTSLRLLLLLSTTLLCVMNFSTGVHHIDKFRYKLGKTKIGLYVHLFVLITNKYQDSRGP